ncbi:MAG: sigma-E processing peptidase SpoIIGA [Tepidanaerobacteraceae bacterium]|nr:sigma-E processing peptidase SpoIIGA [Tepidanaerobacteraceae bacterium]
MVVYFDVVLLINLLMNFLILTFVAMVLKLRVNLAKILSGAIAGCLFLLHVIIPNLAILQGLTFKLILSAAMILLSFSPRSLKDFIKILGFFYLISFMVGGGAFALFYFYNFQYINSGVYGNMLLINNISVPWWILLVSALILLIFFKYFWPLLYRMLSKDNLLVPINVEFDNKKLEIPALIDTGNDLRDPVSNYPVVIVEFNAVKTLFGRELQSLLIYGTEADFTNMTELISNSKWATRFRLIPFESIGRSKGLMIGFKPDMITVNLNNKILEVRDAILGIYQRSLSPDGTYRALLNRDVLNVLNE